jgi:hypothetical protein
VIFHHTWLWSADTLSIIPNLNLFKKIRGAAGGPDLVTMDAKDILVTRRVGSCLEGQMYDPSGCFKVFYSQLCQSTQGWDDQPEDEEVVRSFKEFLSIIKDTIQDLKPWPRSFRPDGYTYRKLVCHHNGSQHMASYSLYLVSAPAGEKLTHSNGFCMLVQATNSIRNHNVLIESSSGLLRVEAAVAFMLSHHDDILSEDPFRLQVESDSVSPLVYEPEHATQECTCEEPVPQYTPPTARHFNEFPLRDHHLFSFGESEELCSWKFKSPTGSS